jgi:hypothetical protein
LTVDAPLDHTPHATDTSIMTRLKKQASSQWKMEASAIEDGSISSTQREHHGRHRKKQAAFPQTLTL